MPILRCSSSAKSIAELAAKSNGELLFLAPDAVKTKKELETALYLAKEAFANGTNISDGVAKEALLFFACETNFSAALEKAGAKDAKDFVLVSGKDIPIAKLKKELRLTSAKPMKLSEFGMKKSEKDFFRSGMGNANSTKKKIGGYFEGELAIEKMALARGKN